jgi:RNA polymerase sigma-70 factor (ECF subfamily)
VRSDGNDGQLFADALVAARHGATSGLSVLFREFQPSLLRYLRAREAQVADDLASETWLAIAQRIKSFEGDRSAFAAWLFTIARHRLADFRRTSSRRRTGTVSEISLHAVDRSAEQIALDNLSAQAAVEIIARVLTSDQAEVILLRVLGDLSMAEAARVMGRDVDWIGVTQHRALKRLGDRFLTRVLVMK